MEERERKNKGEVNVRGGFNNMGFSSGVFKELNKGIRFVRPESCANSEQIIIEQNCQVQ